MTTHYLVWCWTKYDNLATQWCLLKIDLHSLVVVVEMERLSLKTAYTKTRKDTMDSVWAIFLQLCFKRKQQGRSSDVICKLNSLLEI